MSFISNATAIAVVGAVGIVAWEVAHIKIPSIPSPGDLVPKVPGITAPVPSGSYGSAPADVCADIVAWRKNIAPGLFGTGLFAMDPNNWDQFRKSEAAIGKDPGDTPPNCWYPTGTPPGTTPLGSGGAYT